MASSPKSCASSATIVSTVNPRAEPFERATNSTLPAVVEHDGLLAVRAADLHDLGSQVRVLAGVVEEGQQAAERLAGGLDLVRGVQETLPRSRPCRTAPGPRSRRSCRSDEGRTGRSGSESTGRWARSRASRTGPWPASRPVPARRRRRCRRRQPRPGGTPRRRRPSAGESGRRSRRRAASSSRGLAHRLLAGTLRRFKGCDLVHHGGQLAADRRHARRVRARLDQVQLLSQTTPLSPQHTQPIPRPHSRLKRPRHRPSPPRFR